MKTDSLPRICDCWLDRRICMHFKIIQNLNLAKELCGLRRFGRAPTSRETCAHLARDLRSPREVRPCTSRERAPTSRVTVTCAYLTRDVRPSHGRHAPTSPETRAYLTRDMRPPRESLEPTSRETCAHLVSYVRPPHEKLAPTSRETCSPKRTPPNSP